MVLRSNMAARCDEGREKQDQPQFSVQKIKDNYNYSKKKNPYFGKTQASFLDYVCV